MKTHANQVAAWGKLLGHCNDLSESYNPSTASMNRTAMNALLEESQKSIDAVHKAKNDLVTAVNQRHRAFDRLPILGTRIMGALKATGAPDDHVADVNRIRLRFRSLRPGLSQGTAQNESTGQTNGAEVPSVSAPRKRSHLAFESKIQNFAEMMGLLQNDTPYQPNVPDLSIDGLKVVFEELRSKQKAVEDAQFALFKARTNCNSLIFADSGIYGVAKLVKEYFKSLLGTGNETYKAIRKIKFVKR